MKSKQCSHNLQSNHRGNSQRFWKMLMSRLNNLCRFLLDPVRLTPTKTVASHGKVNFSESITTVVVPKLKIEKGNYTAVSTFSIKLWIYLFSVVVLQRYQTVKRTCWKSLSFKLKPIVQRCTRAALTGLQYVAQFPATKDVNMYSVPQKASNQLKLTLKVASVFKKQV